MDNASPLANQSSADQIEGELDDLLTEHETSTVLNVSPRTLQDWRRRGVGVPYIRVEGGVRYRRRHLKVYADRQTYYPKGWL
jgi:hypothetical protein